MKQYQIATGVVSARNDSVMSVEQRQAESTHADTTQSAMADLQLEGLARQRCQLVWGLQLMASARG